MANSATESLLSLLDSFVKIPSNIHEEEMGEAVSAYLQKYGFSLVSQEVEKNRYNIFAQKNPLNKKKAILFYAHLDTVSPQSDWENPRTLVEDGNKITGLGSYDMKGGIVAILQAAQETDAYVKIFFAVDEEKESLGAWHGLENNRDFFNDVELVISAEPNFDLGLHSLTNGRTGRSIYKIICTGKSAHIARYKEGEDAIEMLGAFVNEFYKKREDLFASKDTVAQIRKIIGESNGMTVCNQAMAEIEVLLGDGDTSKSVIDLLQSLSNDLNINAEISLVKRRTPYLEPYYFKDFIYRDEIAEIIKNRTNKEMVLSQRSSVGDDNVLATLGVPVVTWGPDGGNAHSSFEWVDIESVQTLSTMYHDLLLKVS